MDFSSESPVGKPDHPSTLYVWAQPFDFPDFLFFTIEHIESHVARSFVCF